MIPFYAILLTFGAANAIVTVPLTHRPKKRARRKASAYGSKEAEGSLKVKDEVDGEYYGEVWIGTPPQKFLLLIETGTANLWVPSVRCENCDFWTNNSYDNSSSSTWHPRPELGNLSNLVVNGTYSKDTVIIAGLTIDDQTFGEVTHAKKKLFEDAPFDGILGLGPDGQAHAGFHSPMYNLVAQGKIKHNIMGVYLDSGEGNASLLSIGGTEKSLYTEDVFYVPLSLFHIMLPHWLVAGTDIKVNHTSANVCGWDGCHFLMDTGQATIAWGEAFAKQHSKHLLKMIGNVTENCTNADSKHRNADDMPMLTFTIHGRDFDVDHEVYIVKEIDDDSGNTTCEMYMERYHMGYEGLSNAVTLGEAFLRKYYSVYDADRVRMGLAPAKPPAHYGFHNTTTSLQTTTEMFFM